MPVLTSTEKASYDTAVTVAAAAAPKTTALTAGTGLTGGGDLSTGRTFACDFGTASGKVCQGNDSRVVAAAAQQTGTYTLIDAAFASGTTQPTMVSDADMAGHTIGGLTSGASSGTLGVVGASFASSGAETGTGAGQGGLGSTANANYPYKSTDFPGGKQTAPFLKNGKAVLLKDMLAVPPAVDLDAPVYTFWAYRSDAAADSKFRVWWYYVASATGLFTPFTPTVSVTGASLYAPEVVLAQSLPASAGFNGGISGIGPVEMTPGLVGDMVAADGAAATIGNTGRFLDAGAKINVSMASTGDMQTALGTAAAGSSNKAMRGDATLPLPTSAQVVAALVAQTVAATSFNSITGLSSTTPAALGTAAVGTGTTAARADHVHQIVSHDIARWGCTAAPATASTRYAGNAYGAPVSNIEQSIHRAAIAKTLTDIRVKHEQTALASDTLAWTLAIGGVNTALTVTVTAGSTADFSLTGQAVVLAAGNDMEMVLNQSSTTTQAALSGRAVVAGF